VSSMRCVAYVSVALTALTLRVALRASRRPIGGKWKQPFCDNLHVALADL